MTGCGAGITLTQDYRSGFSNLDLPFPNLTLLWTKLYAASLIVVCGGDFLVKRR